uniref:Signal recognition particle GTPase n=1 Tax=Rhabditophanes sp. KR3021 TaxID=114890 RepID=A0AC35TJ56_9BILA
MCSIMISGNEDIKRTELWGMLPESDKSSIQTIENQATSQQDRNAKISMYLSTQVSPSIIDQFVGKNMRRGQEQADTMVKQMNANMDQMNANMAAMNSEMTRQFQEGFPFNG